MTVVRAMDINDDVADMNAVLKIDGQLKLFNSENDRFLSHLATVVDGKKVSVDGGQIVCNLDFDEVHSYRRDMTYIAQMRWNCYEFDSGFKLYALVDPNRPVSAAFDINGELAVATVDAEFPRKLWNKLMIHGAGKLFIRHEG